MELEPVGSIVEALEVFLASVDYPPSDPRAVVAEVARRLAAELDRAPSAMVARELGSHLQYLGQFPNDDPDVVDEIRAKRAQRRVGSLVAGAQTVGAARERTRTASIKTATDVP